MAIMRSLAADGKSILFITHKLKEVRAVADVITVIRQGRVIDTVPPTETENQLATLMVGREVNLTVHKEATQLGEPVLELRDLVVRDDRGLAVVNGVTLSVHAGEIVALAASRATDRRSWPRPFRECGPSNRARSLCAVSTSRIAHRGPSSTRVWATCPRTSARRSRPIDERRRQSRPQYAAPRPFASRGTRNLKAVEENATQLVQRFDIRTTGIDATAGSLSGGNQQKVIVARELSRPLSCFMASQPTRGLDVGSIEYVHRQIVNQRNEGLGVFIISSELDEVVALGDRIAVIHSGKITGVVAPTTSREDIGLLMAGSTMGAHD